MRLSSSASSGDITWRRVVRCCCWLSLVPTSRQVENVVGARSGGHLPGAAAGSPRVDDLGGAITLCGSLRLWPAGDPFAAYDRCMLADRRAWGDPQCSISRHSHAVRGAHGSAGPTPPLPGWRGTRPPPSDIAGDYCVACELHLVGRKSRQAPPDLSDVNCVVFSLSVLSDSLGSTPVVSLVCDSA